MRRRVMMVKTGGKNRFDIVAGDILCAKDDGSKMIFDATDYDSIPSIWTPIGIVVIPPSHDIYGTGEGAAISLRYMCFSNSNSNSNSNPDNGSDSMSYINYGQYDIDTSLTNFNTVNITDNASIPTISTNSYGNLPSDKFFNEFSNIQCTTDPTLYYFYDDFSDVQYLCPSPYLSDGSRNKDYYITSYSTYNALSDFNGIGNTEVLCSLATAQSDWKTASSITNNITAGYSPAACCCWRYHTVGTKQGDWYLPAAGEFGYLMVRFVAINTSITNVKGTPIDRYADLWSSSEHSSYKAQHLYTTTGQIKGLDKNYGTPVRSFIHF